MEGHPGELEYSFGLIHTSDCCVDGFVYVFPDASQFTLGGFEQLQCSKVSRRVALGLPPLPEDSIHVVRSMRAASPPASASDLIEQQQRRARREHKVTDL